MGRDFTYVDDIVEGVVRVMQHPAQPSPTWDAAHPDPATSSAPYRLYNIGSSSPVRLLDYIETLEDCLGKKAVKEFLPMQPGDVLNTFLVVIQQNKVYMKHVLLIITLFLGTITLQAARVVPTLQLDSVVAEVAYPGKTKEVFEVDETGLQRVKRTYQWNTETQDWVGYNMVEQTVNDKSLVVDETYYEWSYGGGNWVKVSRTTNGYNMLGYSTQRMEYTWNGQTWENLTKYENVYNERGRLTSNCRYSWSSSINQWEILAEETISYDEQGRELESIRLNNYWNSNKLKHYKSVSTTTYNDTLRSNTTTGYYWDELTSEWMPSSKSEKQSNTNGLHTAINYYSWNNEHTPYLQKQEYYTYNQKGNITSHIRYKDDNFDGLFDGLKIENEYNENYQRIRTLESYQDGKAEKWDVLYDAQFDYDTFGNTISEIGYVMSWAYNEKVGRKKKVMTYDYTHRVYDLCTFSNEVETSYGGQLPTTCAEYGWDWEANDWQTDPEYTTQYHYSPYTAPTPPEIDNKLQVFLDPLGNILYVDDKEVSLLGTSQEKPVRVYDVSGGLQIISSARIINVSELPNGLYLVTVNGQTRRVMKQ